MKNNFFLIFTLWFSMSNLVAQITPEQMVKRMGRGINIGNVLSAPVEGNWAPKITLKYFQDVSEAGFTCVRIPMDFFGSRTGGDTSIYSKAAGTSDSYTGNIDDYQVSASYLNRVEQVVNWALGEGLVTIIDFHGSTLKTEFLYTFDRKNKHPDIKTDPTSAKRLADLDKFTAIWTAISKRFKNTSENLLFEVVNEPYFEIGEEDMNTINSKIISAIRNTGGNNATRNIIITGGLKNAEEAPTTINPAILNGDDHLIASFHYYKPNVFTKSSIEGKDQNSWGSAADKAAIDAAFDSVLNWSADHDTEILLGEFGADNSLGYDYSTGDLHVVNSNSTGFADGGPDKASRVAYYRYLAEQAINRGFAFTVWDAGPESNKTINKRTDASSTYNYDISQFNVISYNPKNTVKSTVQDTSIWVEDVKDALLTAGEWPLAVDDEVAVKDFVKIYPNPAKEYISIASENPVKKLSVYSVLGRKLFEKSNIKQITDLNDLKAGVYLIRIFLENGNVYSDKFIIEK